MTVICPKLPNNSHNNKIPTIPSKNTALTWCCKNKTIFTIINVKIGNDIEDKICSFFAIINIELLSFYRIYRFYPELILLVFEVIVLWVEDFLFYFWWQDVVFGFRGLLLDDYWWYFWLDLLLWWWGLWLWSWLLLNFVFDFSKLFFIFLSALRFLFLLRQLRVKGFAWLLFAFSWLLWDYFRSTRAMLARELHFSEILIHFECLFLDIIRSFRFFALRTQPFTKVFHMLLFKFFKQSVWLINLFNKDWYV